MIAQITIGRGSDRRTVPLVRCKVERKRAAGAIKGFLFPTAESHRAAMAAGKARRGTA